MEGEIEEIWLACFTDYRYPEDNQIFGAYKTEAAARERIAEELRLARERNTNYPEMNDKKEWYYDTKRVDFINK